MKRNRLLVVEDDLGFRTALVSAMQKRGFEVTPVPGGSAALAWLESGECDLMLLDLMLPDVNGMEVLESVRQTHPAVEVVVLTGHGTIDVAVQATRMGAFHFLTKPCSLDEVEITLHKAQERMALMERTMILQDALSPPDMEGTFIGRSSQYQEILRLVSKVARADSSVLITGETGVGKELVAKLIHTRSDRKQMPFVVVDCACLHETLLQSELFGHEKGAYTGAVQLKHGLFEVADRGTIFLDEIGDISPALQVQLLRVLETGTARRLGGTREIEMDVRVLAATNRDLAGMVERGHFREDLFYRLNTIGITVPPLRERPDDVACLVTHYLARCNERLGQDRRFSPDAQEILISHDWPGNVRQLINVVEQSVILADEDVIGPWGLPPDLQPRSRTTNGRTFQSSIVPLSKVEQHYIEFVVHYMKGHRANAARALGIGERSLYRKLKQFGID